MATTAKRAISAKSYPIARQENIFYFGIKPKNKLPLIPNENRVVKCVSDYKCGGVRELP